MRHNHSLSHHHLTTCDFGQLVPIMAEEVLPGDTFIASTAVLMRIAPLVHPVMHPVDVRVHSFYVPNRLLWTGWEDYITGTDEVTAKPTVTMDATAANWEVLDRMGCPHKDTLSVDALPVRAYNMIFNEWYRDQDLIAARSEDDATLARICWEKDYFTSARDEAQQGTAIDIPFSAAQAPVKGIGTGNQSYTAGAQTVYETGESGSTSFTSHRNLSSSNNYIEEDPNNSGFPNIYADLSGASGGININDFRQSWALQKRAEARAMYGERYTDYLRYLGINPSDGRLNRPEYLGGGKQTISFSEVLATAASTGVDVGDLYGHGIMAMRTRRWRRFFEEFGWVISMLSIRPKTMYQDNVPKKFLRTEATDHWTPELEVMPWQEITEQEVHKDGSAATIFGYQKRYSEYRHALSYVSGSFRGGTEEDWHMARSFASPPTLNGSFVECTPTDRIFSDTSMPEGVINVNHNINARRLVEPNVVGLF